MHICSLLFQLIHTNEIKGLAFTLPVKIRRGSLRKIMFNICIDCFLQRQSVFQRSRAHHRLPNTPSNPDHQTANLHDGDLMSHESSSDPTKGSGVGHAPVAHTHDTEEEVLIRVTPTI